MSKAKWPTVNRDRPCPKCGNKSRCLLTEDGGAGKCWRNAGEVWNDKPARDRRDDDMPAPRQRPKAKGWDTVEAAYNALCQQAGGEFGGGWTYHDASGGEAMRVVRIDLPDGDKQFRPIHRKKGKWRTGDPPGTLPLYNLAGVKGVPNVHLAEGEKCADVLKQMGLAATTTAHGSKSAGKSDLSPIDNATVYIYPDNDDDGRAYASKLVDLLYDRNPGRDVKVIHLPGLEHGEDVADWCEGDRPEARRDELLALADAAPVREPDHGLVITSAADIEPQAVDWLKADDIPLGMVSVVAGAPGTGKTFLTMGYIASIVSNGYSWFDNTPCPQGDVLLISGEDDAARTLVPRLIAHGANMNRVGICELVKAAGQDGQTVERMFHLADVPLLDRQLRRRPGTRLVIIDPVSAFHGGTDGNDNAKMRQLLSPLRSLAERHGVAILLITHLRKSTGIEAVNAVVGSIGLVGAARSAWLVAKDKEDPDRRYFVPIKNNLGNDRTGYAYGIVGGVVAFEQERIDMNGDDVLESRLADPDADQDREDKKRPRDEAAEWLAGYLRDGPRSWEQVKKAGRQAGHAERTLIRCRGDAANWFKPEGYQGAVYWRLEGDTNDVPVPDTDAPSGKVANNGQQALIEGGEAHTLPRSKSKNGPDGPVSHTSPLCQPDSGDGEDENGDSDAESHTSPLCHFASDKGAA